MILLMMVVKILGDSIFLEDHNDNTMDDGWRESEKISKKRESVWLYRVTRKTLGIALVD